MIGPVSFKPGVRRRLHHWRGDSIESQRRAAPPARGPDESHGKEMDQFPTSDVEVDSARARLTHLDRLEAESIHIMREVVAEAERPVMLYSAGKDSAVMLHLARKAFFPAPPPFPLLHVDTT